MIAGANSMSSQRGGIHHSPRRGSLLTLNPRLISEVPVSGGPQGAVWEATIIKAGRSLNGDIYTPEALKNAVHLFDGVPVYSYRLGGTFNHPPEEMEQMNPKGFVENLIGEVKDPRWNDVTRSIVARIHIDDEAARTKMRNQWLRGSRDLVGLSINARGAKDKETGVINEITEVNSLEQVTFPAASGRFDRLVASVTPLQEQARFTNRKWDGDKARFDIDQLARAVPNAVRKWAEARARAEDRDLVKDDLKLPFKEPDGTINLNGVRASLASIGGARDGVELPEDVKREAQEELQMTLERGNKALSESMRNSILRAGEKLGARIKRTREGKDLSVEEAAGRGFARSASIWGQIERGEIIRPPDDVLRSFATILGLSFEGLQELANQDQESMRAAIIAFREEGKDVNIEQTDGTGVTGTDVTGGDELEEDGHGMAKIISIADIILAGGLDSPEEMRTAIEEIKLIATQLQLPGDEAGRDMDASVDQPVSTDGVISEEAEGMSDAIKPVDQAGTGTESPEDFETMKAELAEKGEKLEEATKELDSLKAQIENQAVSHELVVLAEEFNLHDKDTVMKLIDRDAVSVNEEGKVDGLREEIAKLIESHPWIAKVESDAPAAEPPSATPTAPKTPTATVPLTESVDPSVTSTVSETELRRLEHRMIKGDTKAAVKYARATGQGRSA